MHLTSLVQIFSPDADQREASDIPAQVNCVITVLQLECVGENMISMSISVSAHYLSFSFTWTHTYLLHVAPQEWVRWVVDFLPVDRNSDLL